MLRESSIFIQVKVACSCVVDIGSTNIQNVFTYGTQAQNTEPLCLESIINNSFTFHVCRNNVKYCRVHLVQTVLLPFLQHELMICRSRIIATLVNMLCNMFIKFTRHHDCHTSPPLNIYRICWDYTWFVLLSYIQTLLNCGGSNVENIYCIIKIQMRHKA